MRWNWIAVVMLGTVLLPVGHPAAAQELPFTETFEVLRTEWYRNEHVLLRLTRCNNTGATLNLECASPCWLNENVLFRNTEDVEVARHSPGVCPNVCVPETWEAGECRSKTLEWPQVTGRFPFPGDGAPVEPGTYYAETVFGDPPLQTSNFRILAGTMPIPVLGGAALTILLALMMLVGSRVLRSKRA